MAEIAEFIRGITRPICLFLMVLCILALVYQGREVPTWLWGTFVPFFAWWGADRTLRHHHERVLQGREKSNPHPKT